jgi:signal transduction histidine kinase
MRFVDFNFSLTIGTDRRQDLIQIQWFVVIACAYLLVFQDGRLADAPVSLLMLLGPLGSMVIFLHLPQAVFMHRFFPPAMAIVDTILISTAIVLNRQTPWDLFLVFFFGILIAAIGENFLQIIGGCLIAGVLSVLIVPVSTGASFSLDANTLLRIPLLFGSSLLYGYLADQVKREKRKSADLEDAGKRQLLMKDQFFSNVSHELRTPLTAVYQFVTIVLDGLAGSLNADQKDYLGIALRNVKQLQAMVGDLLEATRAETGKLAIHPRGVSLNLSVTETLRTFAANAKHNGIQLTEDLPADLPLLYVDPRRLIQILTNLVDNALKFTQKNGRISIRANVFEEDRGFVRVWVTDTGCGINPDDADKIFDRLYQIEKSFETNRKGLGLGLHITKELVVRHGGRIWLESEPGKGATFHFTLPVFSLTRLLQSLIDSEGHSIKSLSLISAELLPGPDTPMEVAKAIQEVTWLALNQMELPHRTALFPDIVLSEGRGLFYLLQAKDLQANKELAARVEKEIALGKQFRNANCRVYTAVSLIPIPPGTQGIDVEMLAAQIDTRISDAVRRSDREDDIDSLRRVTASRAAL